MINHKYKPKVNEPGKYLYVIDYVASNVGGAGRQGLVRGTGSKTTEHNLLIPR